MSQKTPVETIKMDMNAGPFIGYHDDAELQKKILTGVDDHIAADQVIQGIYSWGEGENFRGCFMGCVAHILKNDQAIHYDSPITVYEAYGFPRTLTIISEQIFENLRSNKAPKFFRDISYAVNLGTDISLVHWKLLYWVLKDALTKYGTPEIRRGCSKALAVVRDRSQGVKVTERRANAAADISASITTYSAIAGSEAFFAADAVTHAAYGIAIRSCSSVASAYIIDAFRFAAEASHSTTDTFNRYEEFAAKLVELLGESQNDG